MNDRPQIVHSPRIIGYANARVLDQMTVAYKAALRLAESGQTIERIELSHRDPVVWLRDTPMTKRLSPVATIVEKKSCTRGTIRATVFNGALIKWQIKS